MKTSLYRHFNSSGVLLYVGVSLNAAARLSQHARYSGWHKDIARVDVEHFSDRLMALEAERLAIHTEKPVHNVQHQGRPTKKTEAIEVATEEIVQRVVFFNPVYTIKEVAEYLRRDTKVIMDLIRSNRLAAFKLEDRTGDTINSYRVTGWQLLEYLEHMNVQNKI